MYDVEASGINSEDEMSCAQGRRANYKISLRAVDSMLVRSGENSASSDGPRPVATVADLFASLLPG
jgi:hypothetical protein